MLRICTSWSANIHIPFPLVGGTKLQNMFLQSIQMLESFSFTAIKKSYLYITITIYNQGVFQFDMAIQQRSQSDNQFLVYNLVQGFWTIYNPIKTHWKLSH